MLPTRERQLQIEHGSLGDTQVQWSTGLEGSEEKSGPEDKCGINSDTNRMDNDPHPPHRGGLGS